MTMLKSYLVIVLTVCVFPRTEGGGPGFFEMLNFKSSIEALPGGGDLLSGIVKSLKGITAEQLHEVAYLLPLLDAKGGHPDGGFLKFMMTINSSPEGHELIQRGIGILGNITPSEINDINSLVPLIAGGVNASHGASLLGGFMNGDTGMNVLTKLMGSNSSSSAGLVIKGLADLLESGSIIGAIERLVCPDGPANTLLLEYSHEIGGETLVSVAKTFLPIVGPFMSLAFSSDNETFENAVGLIKELNEKLQNTTFQREIGSVISELSSLAIAKVFNFIGQFETVPYLYNLTLSEEPLDAIVTLIGDLNTTLILEILGNSSFAEEVIELIENSKSADELGQYLVQSMLDLIAKPSTAKFMGKLFANGTMYVLNMGLDAIMPLLDDTHVLYNISLSRPIDAVITFLGSLNATTLQSVLGNSSISKAVISLVSHSASRRELGGYLIQITLDQLKKPSSYKFMGDILGKVGVYVMRKGFHVIATIVNNPDDLFNISLAKPLETIMVFVHDMNTTALELFLGNSSWAGGIQSFVDHAQGNGSFIDYILHVVLEQLSRPSSHAIIGEMFADISVQVLDKVFAIFEEYVDDPAILTNISRLTSLEAVMTLIQHLDTSKLHGIFGNTTFAESIIGFLDHAGSIETLSRYTLDKILDIVQDPSSLQFIGEVIANSSAMILTDGFQILSSVVDFPEALSSLSLINPASTLRHIIHDINMTKLGDYLGNSSISEIIVDVISILKTPESILGHMKHILFKPAILRLVSPYIGGWVSDILQTTASVISAYDRDDLVYSQLSFGTAITILQNVNITELKSNVNNSTFSEGVVSLASRLQTASDVPAEVQCASDLDLVIQGAMDMDMWALQMLDATGKPGPSILEGAAKFFGNFDECLAVTSSVTSKEGSKRGVRGSYCRVVVLPPQSLLEETGILDTPVPLPKNFLPALEWHLCLPESCNENILSSVLSALPLDAINASVYKVECQSDDNLRYEPAAIFAISVVCVIFTLTILATCYDTIYEESVRLRMKNEKSANTNGYMPATKTDSGVSMMVFENSEREDTNHEDLNCYKLSKDNDADDDEREGTCRRILLAFSFPRNTEQIFNTEQRKDSIGCIHGLRVISMAFIILGHVIIYTYGVTVENGTRALDYVKYFIMQPVVNATLSVDTFFLIGGCLVAYIFIKETNRNGKLTGRQMVKYYVHRFLRLWPVYLVVLMLYTCLMSHVLDGPLRTDGMDYDNTHCTNNWWTNVLFINNLVNVEEGCMRWTWFMAVDMQFYVIAPLALVPLVMGLPVVGVSIMVLLFLVQIATYSYKEYYINGTILKNVEQFEQEIYFTPWCRVGVFSMGMMLGYILNKHRHIRIPRSVQVIGWVISLTLGLLCLFVTWDEWRHGHLNWSRDVRLAYETLSRPTWALFISWIIFVCATGYGGFVNRFLSWSAWVPLGRLTYGAYLIHPILITYSDFHKRALIYVDIIYIIYQFIGTFAVSYILSFVVTVLVEVPCTALERLALSRAKGR